MTKGIATVHRLKFSLSYCRSSRLIFSRCRRRCSGATVNNSCRAVVNFASRLTNVYRRVNVSCVIFCRLSIVKAWLPICSSIAVKHADRVSLALCDSVTVAFEANLTYSPFCRAGFTAPLTEYFRSCACLRVSPRTRKPGSQQNSKNPRGKLTARGKIYGSSGCASSRDSR